MEEIYAIVVDKFADSLKNIKVDPSKTEALSIKYKMPEANKA